MITIVSAEKEKSVEALSAASLFQVYGQKTRISSEINGDADLNVVCSDSEKKFEDFEAKHGSGEIVFASEAAAAGVDFEGYLRKANSRRKLSTTYGAFCFLTRAGVRRYLSRLNFLRRQKEIPPHRDEAFELRRKFFDFFSPRIVLKPPRPAVVLTHDVDNALGFEGIRRMLDAEESLDLESNWYVVNEAKNAFFDEFPELRKRSFMHGLNHSCLLLEEVNRSPASLSEEIKKNSVNRGFRAPWLHYSPEMFDCLQAAGVAHDSSVPSFENFTPFMSPGGCGEIIPFKPFNFKRRGFHSFVEYPVTAYQDYAFYTIFRSTQQRMFEYYASRLDFVVSNNGVFNFLTHPDEKDSGSTEGIKIYRRVLERVSEKYADIASVITPEAKLEPVK